MWRVFGQGYSKSSSGLPFLQFQVCPLKEVSTGWWVPLEAGCHQGLRLRFTRKAPELSLRFLFCEISALATLTEPSTVQRKLDNAYKGLVKLECVPCE